MKIEPVLKEGIMVGLLTILVGTFISKLMTPNKLTLFLFWTGFTIHILCEYFGVNKWYCRHGSACSA